MTRHINRIDLGSISPVEYLQLVELAADGRPDKIKLLKCADYDAFSPDVVRLFTHMTARYLLPTVELVDWLKDLIGDRKAIEIGSGTGDLARFLGIPATDNYCQEWPEVKAYYALTGQPPVNYGKDVERLDALEAVEKYKPDVVLGSWVTQWIDPNLPYPDNGGSMHGVKESELLKKVLTYIVVGAEGIHGRKNILSQPHKVFNVERIARSRRTDNRVWVWGSL